MTTHGAEGWAHDVAVVSPREAWIVGYQGGDDSYVPLALHWSGLRWERVTIPLARGVSAGLRGVTVVAPDEVWAVGFTQVWKQGFGNLPTRPFAARWDGRRWIPVPIKVDGLHGWLEAVVRAPTGRIWAVGRDWTPKTSAERTLTLRWNGSAWHRVPSLSPGTLSRLWDVTLTGGRLWALGGWSDGRDDHALAARWTGERWKRVDVPVAGELYAGTPAAAGLWAVGTSRRGPAVVRWDGGRWHVRHPFEGRKALHDVIAPSPGTVWVVGRRAEGRTGSTERPFVARAVHGVWRSEPTPARRGWFAAIAGTPNDLWIAHVKPAPHDPFTYTNTFHRC